jgi:hypothetical protein
MAHLRRDVIAVERHSIAGFVVYEISGEELEQLERDPATIGEDFSFALFGLTVGASFLIAITTTTIASNRLYESYLLVSILGFLMAVYFGIRWRRGRRKFRAVIRKIRERVGPFGQQGQEAQADAPSTPASPRTPADPA